MKIGILKETADGERRVAATPDTIKKLIKRGFEISIEESAGVLASFTDDAYKDAGATVSDRPTLFTDSDLIMKLNPPSSEEVDQIPEGKKLISYLWPAENTELVEQLRSRNISAFAMDAVPRISRAQKLDALSSMSNVSGYRAVIEAAYHYGSFFNAQFTAAGRIDQARVLVIGAGVAGLAAIGAAKGLGAHVSAFDVRAAAREQVESMGAEFVEVQFEESGEGEGGYAKVMSDEFIEAEMALFRSLAPKTDIVITTALIPGRPAPKLWMQDAVELMKPGSVVVDLAAERGGNCALTVPDEVIDHQGVKIVGWSDLASRLAPTASQLYGMNLVHFLRDLEDGEGSLKIDLEEVVTRCTLITHEGETIWPPPPLSELDPSSIPKEMQKKDDVAPAPQEKVVESTSGDTASQQKKEGRGSSWWLTALALLWVFLLIRAEPGAVSDATRDFLNHVTVFALSCFIGWQVIWNVSHALHTPLMSVTNAISGIILVGGMLQAQGGELTQASFLGGLAVLLAMINVVGGFAVTKRMLAMFRK